MAKEPFKRVLERLQYRDAAYLLTRVRHYRRAEKAAKMNLRIYVDSGMDAIVAVDASEWEAYQQALEEERLR